MFHVSHIDLYSICIHIFYTLYFLVSSKALYKNQSVPHYEAPTLVSH